MMKIELMKMIGEAQRRAIHLSLFPGGVLKPVDKRDCELWAHKQIENAMSDAVKSLRDAEEAEKERERRKGHIKVSYSELQHALDRMLNGNATQRVCGADTILGMLRDAPAIEETS